MQFANWLLFCTLHQGRSQPTIFGGAKANFGGAKLFCLPWWE